MEHEIVLLRRTYGISAREYLHELPGWEADLLLDVLEDPAPEPDDTDEPRSAHWFSVPT